MAEKKKATKKEVKEVKNRLELTITIDGDDWKEALDKSFAKNVKDVKVDGFRKGKVPRNIFEKKFGKESLYMDAADSVLQLAYIKLLNDNKDLVPVVQPQVAIKNIDEEKIEFNFVIITRPEVKVNKYTGLKVKKDKVEVTKEEIDHELSHVVERYTELEVKEGKVENGDIAVIDFEGFKDGVAFEGGKGENYSLEIGSNTFIPGFEEQVIGLETGEEKDINVTFPEEYPAEELKGQPVVFKIKVNEIKHKVTRELDEEFFEDLGMEGVDTEEKLRAELEANIKVQKEAEAENKYIDAVLEAVGKNTEVDIPEEMVEEEIDRLLRKFEEQMRMQGLNLDMYYQFTGSNEEMLRSQMEKEAYNHVLYRLMMEEIAKLEKLEVSDEDADKEAEELANKYQMKKEEFLNLFGGVEMVKYDMEMRKVLEFLKEENK